jgi:HEAT repeat protein
VSALSQFCDPRAKDALVVALSDSNEEVREMAATGLGEIGDVSLLPLLERAADRDPIEDVRNAAIKAIERIRAQESARKSQKPK